MENADALKAEIKALKVRLTSLSEVSLRISGSLDLNTVLHEVTAAACTLSGAETGEIVIRDESGQMMDFVTHGPDPGVDGHLLDLPYGPGFWAYLSAYAEPLRLKDLAAHLVSLGLPGQALKVRSFLGMPVRHQDLVVGFFYLFDKEDAEEFTREDEETMTLFASLAGAAIGNARKRHDEQQAGDDLEALIEITPMEVLERQRSEFMSMVNQELTAPLSTIKGCSAAAVSSSSVLSAAESEQFFRIIDMQADHMRRLISDLMDSAEIESGSLSLAVEPVALSVMAEKARGVFADGGGRHPVRIDLPDDLPRVRADQRRIVQVLGHLLSNASRHSPDTAAIGVEARLSSGYVEVSVVDEGPGIPTGRLPHLFSKYARTGGEERGAGLALAICKGLVEAHGGRIRAEPRRGAQGGDAGLGTRFTFTIPAADDAGSYVRPDPAGKRPRPDRKDDSRPLILVVDDDPQALVYIRETLEKTGFRTTVTGDPEQAKELVESHQPDLVLLDLVLPGTDGFELMKSLPENPDRPVVFISAYGREETIARAMELGASDYIVKPFSPTELTARIRSALRHHAGPPEPFRAGDLAIDYEERRVELKGRPLRLTATEYDLLRLLSTHAGRVVTYDRILGSVWNTRSPGDARLVRVFVKKLRHLLGDDAKNPKYIFTVPRVGYRMAGPADLEEPAGTG